MTSRPDRHHGFRLRRLVWSFLVGTMLAFTSAFARRLCEEAGTSQVDKATYHRELRGYIVGLVLALVFTAAAFAVVRWLPFPVIWCEITIGILALIQVIVHFRFFIHISPSEQKSDDLHVALFSSLILLVMIGGTVWILANLATRMY